MVILHGIIWVPMTQNIELPESSTLTIPTVLARILALITTIGEVCMLGFSRYRVGMMLGNIAQNDHF